MSNKPTNTPTDTVITDLSNDEMMRALLGIDESQVLSDSTTTTKTKEPTTKADFMKDEAKNSITAINKKHGKYISFVTLSRSGFKLDASGNAIKNKDGKKIPAYKKEKKDGYFTIDKVEVHNETLGRKVEMFVVCKMIQYTDRYEIADYTEIKAVD